jgi:pimeloyl-ACP methyl ester carboxylesterase
VSSITTDQGIVHYEVFGRGRPVILLHGWLGSWGLWQDTMAWLGAYYRTYALDFWGFGESGKKRESYYVQDFVSLVDQFMDSLGIQQAPLVGHSMGGTVSLSVAIQYPQRVSRAVVIGSPIAGTSLKLFPTLVGIRPIGFIIYHNLWGFKIGYRLLSRSYTRDPNWVSMMDRDISRLTLESFFTSIGSLRRTDLRPLLSQVHVPVMGMYGATDNVVQYNQWQALRDGVPQARIERFQQSGHFIMLDNPALFREKLKGFLDEDQPAR